MPRRWAGARPRACSRKRARSAGFAIPSMPSPTGSRIAAFSASMPAPAKARRREISAVIAGEMEAMAGNLSEAEVARARAQLKVSLLMGMERPGTPRRADRRAIVCAGQGAVGGGDRRAARCHRCRRGETLCRAGDAGRPALHRRRRARSANWNRHAAFARRFGAAFAWRTRRNNGQSRLRQDPARSPSCAG